MLKLFKKKVTAEMIHSDFYNEAIILLTAAQKELESKETKVVNNYSRKASRLRALGFDQTKEIRKFQDINSINNKLFKERQLQKHTIEEIEYFQQKYPQYKYITEESVKNLCKKYGLIYSTVDKYIGTVPEENLHSIESFKIDAEDKVYIENNLSFRIIDEINYSMYKYHLERIKRDDEIFRNSHISNIYHSNVKYSEALLEIAAPVKDFDTRHMEVKDYKLVNVEDPIVLQPVMYKDSKGYLIVTAWGPESEDELVINQKMN